MKKLVVEIRHPHATPRHRISEKQCPDSNLGSLFLNDLGGFQKAFFILSTCNTISCVTEYARKLQQMT